MENGKRTAVEWILPLTAFAAGSVDVISFAMLGGVLASAMTGNLALLAFYVAQGDSRAALSSVVALGGFVVGCAVGFLERRGRPPPQALAILLASEAGLLLLFAVYALTRPHLAQAAAEHLQIVLLAAAMGLQAVIGQAISLTTIVFTTTLTKLVGAVADSAANRSPRALKDIKTEIGVVAAYFCGALLAGASIVHKLILVVLLPCFAVAAALAVRYASDRERQPE